MSRGYKRDKLNRKQSAEFMELLNKMRTDQERDDIRQEKKARNAGPRGRSHERYKSFGFAFTEIDSERPSQEIKPKKEYVWTEGQQEAIDLAELNDILVISAPAGTGKTHIAAEIAVKRLLNEGKSIKISRPAVEASDNSLGFLPGNIDSKMQAYVQPIHDLIEKMTDARTLKEFIRSKKVEVRPINYMRGCTFDDCTVIIDEAQNMTDHDLKLIVTRIGENTKIIITGDEDQCDLTLPEGKLNGIQKAKEVFGSGSIDGAAVVGEHLHQIVRNFTPFGYLKDREGSNRTPNDDIR